MGLHLSFCFVGEAPTNSFTNFQVFVDTAFPQSRGCFVWKWLQLPWRVIKREVSFSRLLFGCVLRVPDHLCVSSCANSMGQEGIIPDPICDRIHCSELFSSSITKPQRRKGLAAVLSRATQSIYIGKCLFLTLICYTKCMAALAFQWPAFTGDLAQPGCISALFCSVNAPGCSRSSAAAYARRVLLHSRCWGPWGINI